MFIFVLFLEVEVESFDNDEFDPSIDPYPEHEPIMQPFDESYEEEQAFEEQRMKVKNITYLNGRKLIFADLV
jgi:hypothetical protein